MTQVAQGLAASLAEAPVEAAPGAREAPESRPKAISVAQVLLRIRYGLGRAPGAWRM